MASEIDVTVEFYGDDDDREGSPIEEHDNIVERNETQPAPENREQVVAPSGKTRKELLEEAASLGIKGRHSLNKAALENAIQVKREELSKPSPSLPEAKRETPAESPTLPAPEIESAKPSVESDKPDYSAIKQRVTDTAYKLGGNKWNSRVYLADLRDAMPELSTEDQNALLKEMQLEGHLVMARLDNPMDITDRHEKAAIHTGLGTPRHIAYFEKPASGGKRNIQEPKTAPPQPATETTESKEVSEPPVTETKKPKKGKTKPKSEYLNEKIVTSDGYQGTIVNETKNFIDAEIDVPPSDNFPEGRKENWRFSKSSYRQRGTPNRSWQWAKQDSEPKPSPFQEPTEPPVVESERGEAWLDESQEYDTSFDPSEFGDEGFGEELDLERLDYDYSELESSENDIESPSFQEPSAETSKPEPGELDFESGDPTRASTVGVPETEPEAGPLFEATAGDKGGAEPPGPPKPPTTFDPSFPEDDGDDDDDEDLPELPSDIDLRKSGDKAAKDLEKKAKANELRRKRLKITQAKRRADKQNTIHAKRERIRRRQQRQDINDRAKQAKTEIKSIADRGDSDRLIRRIATFGIGRAVGIDGGLITALAEILIFQPEIEQAAKQVDELLAQAEKQHADELQEFEAAKTETSINRDGQSIDIAETVDEARLALSEGRDVDPSDVEAKLHDILGKNVEIDPEPSTATGTPKTGPSTSPGASTGPTTPGSGQTPPGASQGPSQASTATGGSGPKTATGGSGGGIGGFAGALFGGAGGNAPGGLPGFGEFGGAMALTTQQLLMANVALHGLKMASDAVSDGFKMMGKVVTSPDSPEVAAEAVGGIGKVAGTAIGGAFGYTSGILGMAAGPIGGVAGVIIGKAISSAIIDPLVSFIEAGHSMMKSAVGESIGGATVEAKAEANIERLIQRIDNSQRIDDDTAEYVQSSSEFALAINDLKASLVPVVGPLLNILTSGLTTLVKLSEVVTIITEVLMECFKITEVLRFIGDVLWVINAGIEFLLGTFRTSKNNSAGDFMQGVYDFFGGNSNTALQGSLRDQVRNNTPSNLRHNPHGILNNLQSFNP